MKIPKFSIVVVLCIVTANAEAGAALGIRNGMPIGPDLTSASPSSSTTKPPTPTPATTTTTSTTTSKPTTSTIAPTTSTTKPSTTNKPTTTVAPTTTSKPTPTTSGPTTTPSPVPAKPEVGFWNITDPVDNKTCIMAKMALQIEVDYMEKNISKNIILNVPSNASSEGTCSNDYQSFSISWNATQNYSDNVSFSFTNNLNTSVSLGYLGVVISGLHFSNESMGFFYNHTEFEVPLQHSYKCNKEQVLTLTRKPEMKTNCSAILRVSQLQMQAFKNNSTDTFDDAIDCINSSTSDIVPIAVGCALAALVVIVLLAYLYGRRRSQARGYLSMFAETKREEDYIPMKTLSCFQ